MTKKLLLVRLDHLGDVVVTTPLVRALAKAGYAVDVIVPAALQGIFAGSEYVQTCYTLEAIAPQFPRRWWPLARWMRLNRYEVIVLPYARPKQLCWASFFSGARQRIAMWAGIWGRITGHKCLRSKVLSHPRPAAAILLDCAKALGIETGGVLPDFRLSGEELSAASQQLSGRFGEKALHSPLVGIHPGCAGNACNLPPLEYARLATLILTQTDWNVIITGVKGELPLLKDWPAAVLQDPRCWNAMGALNLRALAGIISAMHAYVCPSTGPLHVASALGCPTISPFCPLPPLNAAIWGNQNGKGIVVEPVPHPCRQNQAGQPIPCDFRGNVTAEALFEQVRSAIEPRASTTTAHGV